MTGTDLCVNLATSVPVIFEPPCILGGIVHTRMNNIKDSVLASKETGLEVNADNTQYMVMSRDQDAGRSHNVKTDNSSCERVFKCLGTN